MDYRLMAEDLINSIVYQTLPTEEPRQLSSGECGILNYLHFRKNGVLAGELSRDLGITTGRTAIALKSLEKKGLIQRNTSQFDRRCVIVCITESGIQEAESMRKRVLDSTEQLLRALGENDAREYVRLFKRIIELTGTLHD